jgi:hypothetical protein
MKANIPRQLDFLGEGIDTLVEVALFVNPGEHTPEGFTAKFGLFSMRDMDKGNDTKFLYFGEVWYLAIE